MWGTFVMKIFALAMADVITDETKHIYLAHLSLDNNMKELARMSVSQVLEEKGFGVGEAFEIHDTDPKMPTKFNTYNSSF